MFMGIDLRKLFLSALVLAGAVLVPAYLIKLSNAHVFPSTLEMANGMLIITILAAVASMLVASHEAADDRLRFVAIAGKFLLGLVLWWNLVGHWQLAREVDAAQSGVAEAKVAREDANRDAEAAKTREMALSASRVEETRAAAQLADAERRRSLADAERCRVTRNCAPSTMRMNLAVPAPVPSPVPMAVVASPSAIQPRVTPDEVRAAWNPSLTSRAYIEAGVGILLLVLLGTLWHVDLDHDGWADRIQRLPASVMARLYPEAYARYYPQGAPGVGSPSPAQALAGSPAMGVGAAARPVVGFAPTSRVGAAAPTAPTPLAGTSAPTAAPSSAPTAAAPIRPGFAAPTAPTAPGAQVIDIIGYRMPVIENVEWEGKSSKCVIVAGWIPAREPGDRRAPRLGQFGKRRLTELFAMSEAERRDAIFAQIELWKIQKQQEGF